MQRELSLLRARSMEALKQKARRGELFFTVAVGYVKAGRDKIVMDPNLRVREAIGLVFTRFAETIPAAVEASSLYDGEQSSHQPRLCRRLCFWQNRQSGND